MPDSDKVFSGSIPEIYDTYLVPLIFEGFAADMAQRVAHHGPDHILETAAGSGVVARAMAPTLKSSARYVVTDLNQPMLDRAAKVQGVDNRITRQQANALELPFSDAEFDVVCCQFGVMFFPDRVAGYREARRVLKPGGRFIFNVWDRISQNVFADDVTNALKEMFPDDPPLFMVRTPHGYHDVEMIRRELEAAGFSDIEIETREELSRAPSPRHPAIAYCQGTPLRSEIEARDANRLSEATDYAATVLARKHGEGEAAAKIQGHVITAQK